jgi:hypothetical protein
MIDCLFLSVTSHDGNRSIQVLLGMPQAMSLQL